MGHSADSDSQIALQHKSRAGQIGLQCIFLKITAVKAAFLLIFSGCTILSIADTAARLNGAADFLNQRSRENSLYMFSRAMKKQSFIQQYMPNTSIILKSSGLRSLLLVDSLEWKNSVEKDLAHLPEALLQNLQANLDTTLFDVYSSLTDSLPGAFEGVEVRADGDTCSCRIAYPIYKCTCGSSATKDIASSARLAIMGIFKFSFEYTTIAQLSSKLQEFRLRDLTDISKATSFSDALKNIDTDRFSSISDSIEKWRPYLTGDTSSLYLVDMLATFYSRLDSALDFAVKMADTNESFESRVSNTFSVITFINQILGDVSDLSSGSFSDFRQYVLFLARVADAESAAELKSVLRTVVAPSVNFQNKREYQGLSVSIASYLGIAAGIESGNGIYKRNWSAETAGRHLFGGLTTPVGIELSKGWSCGWSTGVLLPIIDISPALNTILYNGVGDHRSRLDLEDLLVPGVCLTVGIKDCPVAIGAGWYKGKSIRTDTSGEHHLYCFAAFDLPLLYWSL